MSVTLKKIPILSAEVEDNNVVTRSQYFINKNGNMERFSLEKMDYTSLKHKLLFDNNDKAYISLDLKSSTPVVSKKENFNLKELNSNLLIQSIISDNNETPTVDNSGYKLIKTSSSLINNINLSVDDVSPTHTLPLTRSIKLANVNPTLNMLFSDVTNKRFHILSLPSISMSINDIDPTQTQKETHTLKPVNTASGTPINISLTYNTNITDTISLDSFKMLLYNSEDLNLNLGLTLNKESSNVHDTSHTMKFATSASIKLKLDVKEDNVVSQIGTIKTLTTGGGMYSNLSLYMHIFDTTDSTIT